MYTEIKMTNIKCFQSIDIDFKYRQNPKNMVVFLGAFGAGKSTLLEGVTLIHQLSILYEQNWIADQQRELVLSENLPKSQKILANWIGIDPHQNGCMSYRFLLGRTEFHYSFIFDSQGNICEEFLYCERDKDRTLMFERSRFGFKSNDRFFTEEQIDMLQEWSKSDDLLLLPQLIAMKSYHFALGNKLYRDIQSVMDFYTLYFNSNLTVFNQSEFVTGKFELSDFPVLKAREKLIQSLLNFLWPKRLNIHYEIRQVEHQLIYQLCLKKYYEKEFDNVFSIMDRKILNLCQGIVSIIDGKNVVIDDVDALIDSETLESLLKMIDRTVCGQCLMSLEKTHCLLYMSVKQMYLLDYRRSDSEVIALSQLAKTQNNSNNRLRYEKGVFGRIEREQLYPLERNLQDYLELRQSAKTESESIDF